MDWAGIWFGIAERLGESMKIISAKIDSKGNPHWIVMDHSKIDGIGAVTQLLHGPEASPPQAKLRGTKRPGRLKTLMAILKHYRSRSQRTRWKKYDSTQVGKSPTLSWTVFSVSATNAVKQFAVSQKVSLNSLLLLTLDQAVRARLTEGGSTRWSIPVNMRGLTNSAKDGNQVSFLNVTFPPAISLGDCHRLISMKFKEGNHWANWALMHMGKYIGLERAENLYRKGYDNPNPETGTFSNLGEWHSDLISQDEAFITAAPTAKLTPVTVAAITVNGKLSVLLQIHPTLRPSPNDIPELLELWLANLGELSNVKFDPQKIYTEKSESIL